MPKTATVQAQQMWEYKELTRKTADYLARELNDSGQQGWELVSLLQAKDRKNEMAWIAFLKRPYVSHGSPPPAQVAAAGDAASSHGEGRVEPSQAKTGPVKATGDVDEFELEEPVDLLSAVVEENESPVAEDHDSKGTP